MVRLRELFEKALDARDGSYSPYSRFRVGACLLANDGSLIAGANIENASYGAAICAERTAIVKAVSSGVSSFEAIAITSDLDHACSPCGICRQVMCEFFAPAAAIYLVPSGWKADTPIVSLAEYNDAKDKSNKVVKTSMQEILPLGFGPEDLTR